MKRNWNTLTLAGLLAVGATAIVHAKTQDPEQGTPGQQPEQQGTPGQEGIPGQEDVQATPGATRMELRTITATVTAIDKKDRMVTLRGEDGEEKTISVPEEVKQFDRVKVGDQIDVGYYESLAVSMAKPGKNGMKATTTTQMKQIEGGQARVRETTAVVKIVDVDTANNEVTFVGPKGKQRSVKVSNPQIQERLQTLKPGESVQITYVESTAVQLKPASNGQQQKNE